ncbi:Golgi-associated plant pathogenesis-related protein 1 [Orchesella cincta]|uniref:Golgi-associated plant pathogenesis-related protein 1 n=1 Tax=Orchesella cincta TaxID=48709 RepID=A0A1D2MGZ8_ORCCI|nr:Golgi-associated plant pathogenesis-related protein 1 [Orchesella cincta]
MGFNKFRSTIFSATCIILLSLCSAQDDIKQFQWITPNEAKQNLSQLIPAGLDADDWIVYIARLDGWLPGKGLLNNGVFYGYFSYDGQEHRAWKGTSVKVFGSGIRFVCGTAKLLVVPIGTTSWIQTNAQIDISQHAIVSGSDQESGETLYICRGWQDEGKTLMVGRLVPSSGICYIPHQYQLIALNTHNEHRATHHLDPLSLTDDLNHRAVRCAEYYAAMRNIDHSCPYKNGSGENLWGSCCGSRTSENVAQDSSNGWYSEVERYDYDCNCVSNAGHFTAMVWKNSRELGFGVATIDAMDSCSWSLLSSW